MKKSELLRKAKEQLSTDYGDYKERYICLALGQAGRLYLGEYSHPTVEQLRNWITSDLLQAHRHSGLENWLLRDHPDVYAIIKDDYIELQKLRHRWLDWMVTYWEEKGE